MGACLHYRERASVLKSSVKVRSEGEGEKEEKE